MRNLNKIRRIKTVKKTLEVVEKIKVARSFGDLSENSEYDAKDEQGFIEQDIQRIEHMIRNALIIEDNGDNNVVQIGKTVTFIELEMKKKKVIKSLVLLKLTHLKENF